MDKHLLQTAEKYEAEMNTFPGASEAFLAGAKYQAKQDAMVSNFLAQSHASGGFSALGFKIAIAILRSVGIE